MSRDLVGLHSPGWATQGPEAHPARNGAVFRRRPMKDASGASLESLVKATIAVGAILHTDAWAGYNGLSKLGYGHRPRSQNAAVRGEHAAQRAAARTEKLPAIC